jgi:hypothetical protein
MGEQMKGFSLAVGYFGDIWQKICTVKGSRVIQMFIWKAYYNIQPTKGNPFCLPITFDPLCPLCERMEEISGHILWSCPSAQDAWLDCNRKLHKYPGSDTDFIQHFGNLMCKLEEEEMQIFVAMALQIWLRYGIFGGVAREAITPPAAIIQKAREQIHECEQAQKLQTQDNNNPCPTKPAKKWKKP